MDQATLTWHVDDQEHTYTLSGSSQAIVGRRRDSTIVLPVKTVSRQHALLFLQGKRLIVVNLSRVNPIWIGEDRQLAHNDSYPLKPGDSFRVGSVEINVSDQPDVPQRVAKIRCINCRRIQDYDPKGFCPWCGYALAAGQTIFVEES